MDSPRQKNPEKPKAGEPDKGKCRDRKSRDLTGKPVPGDRGNCEKESATQGSE
jgi:hypothetical protein